MNEVQSQERLFDQRDFKKVYEEVDKIKLPFLKSRLSSFLPEDTSRKVLDVGSGPGEYQKLFPPTYQYYCIDISSEQIRQAKKKGLHALRHDILKPFPFRPNTFDVVLSLEVLEHVIDGDALLQNIRTVLKTEGYLVLTTPNIAGINGRIRCIRGRRPLNIDARYSLSAPGHVRAFDTRDIRDLMSDNAFDIISFFGFDYSKFLGKPLNVLTRFKPFLSLCGTFVIVAKKR